MGKIWKKFQIQIDTKKSGKEFKNQARRIGYKRNYGIDNLKDKEEQIIETRDKPQHLATQRLLSCLQYPDATKSSTKDLSLSPRTLKGVGCSL